MDVSIVSDSFED